MKINKLCYCPKCGKKYFRHLDEKKFECDNCKFIFYKNPGASVAAIIEYDGKIIMTRRGEAPGKGKLDLPGGFVDENETLEESLLREINEELGLEINDIHYLCSFPNKYPFKGIVYSTIDSIFICKTESINITYKKEEIEQYVLLKPQELIIDDVAFASIRNALKAYLKMLGFEIN